MLQISNAVNQRINQQIVNELGSYYLYLAMSCELHDMGYQVFASFYARQAEEERGHAMKFLRYLQERASTVRLGGIPEPRASHGSPRAIAEAALQQELLVTSQIHEIVSLSEQEKDYATNNFLQWFVDEQVEEVDTARKILQLITLAGDANLLLAESRVAELMNKDED